MPEPLIVIALLAFGFIAGWVVRAAVGGRAPTDQDRPEPAPRPAVEPRRADEQEPQPAAEPAPGQPAASRLVPAPAATPDLGRAVQAYETVVDEWLDDDGQIDDSGRRSVEELDAAVDELERAGAPNGAAEAVAALAAARELIRERRSQALDADTNRQLAELERAFP